MCFSHLNKIAHISLIIFKVLTLFWTLAHSNDVSLDIIDQALSAHVKILDYSCTQYREAQKMKWLDRCVDELKSNSVWVLPALKQIREICCLYQVAYPCLQTIRLIFTIFKYQYQKMIIKFSLVNSFIKELKGAEFTMIL